MDLQDATPCHSVTVLLAEPRGFCAGVERAIQIVEQALHKHGRPVYVRHEIVHNRRVVKRLEDLGAVFVEDLDEVPDGRPVVFSAHGVPRRVFAEARRRRFVFFDATCPLVSKVHMEARRQHAAGRKVILIGHAGHPEVIGTMGQLPAGAITLVETVEDVAKLESGDSALAYVTQTTLSVADTQQIIDALKQRFPTIDGPRKDDICYATTNRQEAVRAIAPYSDAVLVVGAPNSSNSQRLKEVALQSGAGDAMLIQDAEDIDWARLGRPHTIGLTAGASAPEELVEDVLAALGDRFPIVVKTVATSREDVTFKLPRALCA